MDSTWNTSYVFGIDNRSGWGDRYFFTYYSEFGQAQRQYSVLEIALLTTIFLLSLCANVSIIICVARYAEMRTVTNYFVLNLAISDLLFALTIPMVAYTRSSQSWQLGDVTCRITPYVQFVSGIVLLWTLACISFDRHRCIVVPPYRSPMTAAQVGYTCAAIWAAAAVAVLPVAFWFQQIAAAATTTPQIVCTLVFPRSDAVRFSVIFTVVVVVFACLLPMCLLVYHYQQIFWKILSTKNAWATSCVVISARTQTRRHSELSLSDIFVPWPRRFSAQMNGGGGGGGGGGVSRHGSLSTQEELRLNKHIKVVRVLFLNVLVVLVMWLPITMVMVLIHVDGRRENDDFGYFLRSRHFIAALSVALLNTVVNPLLYGVLSDNFRACLLKLWCGRGATRHLLTIRHVAPSAPKVLNNNNNNKNNKRPSASLSEKSERGLV